MILTSVSLFAGCGGLDIGVDKAGFRTICSVESDPHCVATLRHNTPGKAVWQVDVRALDPDRVMDVLGLGKGEISLLHGGPPCQPFSQIGRKDGLADPRGALVFEMVRFAKAMRPTAVLIEQVPQFLNTLVTDKRTMFDVLRDKFRYIGYKLSATVLDAADFKVPQHRRRAFLVGVPRGQEFEFPLPRIADPKPVGEVIDDLPPAVSLNKTPLVPNHIDVTPERDRYRISFVPEGLWLSKVDVDAPADAVQRLTVKDTTKYRRLSRDRPSLTLRCGEILYHHTEDRYLTPREAARIQGFPDRHVLVGPIRRRTGVVRDLDQHRQVANAVPPPLAQAVAKSLRTSLCL